MSAYLAASEDVPGIVREALQDAMEIAIANVPAIEGPCGDLPRRVGLDVVSR